MLLMMAKLTSCFDRVARRLRDDEQGQGMVEYALIIALVGIALVAGLGLLTGALQAVFKSITGTLTTAA